MLIVGTGRGRLIIKFGVPVVGEYRYLGTVLKQELASWSTMRGHAEYRGRMVKTWLLQVARMLRRDKLRTFGQSRAD
jgi:hypothetical protein